MTAVPVSGLVPLVPGAGPCQPTSAAAAQLQGNMAAVAAAAAMAPSTNPLINYQGYFFAKMQHLLTLQYLLQHINDHH